MAATSRVGCRRFRDDPSLRPASRAPAESERLLAAVGRELARQRRDVDRLEQRSAARLLASLRGTREDDLARERAEADLAGRREEDARARLRTLRGDLQAAQARRMELAEAPRIHAALLDEKRGPAARRWSTYDTFFGSGPAAGRHRRERAELLTRP